jgi:hypothetical protein
VTAVFEPRNGFWAVEMDMPSVPTTIVPLTHDRQVLLKIGKFYMVVGQGSRPNVT